MKDIHVRVPLNRASFEAFVPDHVNISVQLGCEDGGGKNR